MLAALVLFAEEGAKQGPEGGNLLLQNPMMPLLLIFIALWFIVILPAQRRERKQKETLASSLKKNDEVLTSSGIIGTVHNIRPEDDEVTIRVDDNCKIRMKRSSIVQILKAKEAPETSITPAK